MVIAPLTPFIANALEVTGVVLGIGGAFAMAMQRYRMASSCWVVGNVALIVLALSAGLGMLAFMYVIYCALAMVSLINLARSELRQKRLLTKREKHRAEDPREAEPRLLPP